MNKTQHSLRRVLPAALLALLLALALYPAAGRAQDATATPTATTAPAEATPTTPTDNGNLSINSVQPGTVVNTGDTEIVVTGTGFVNGSVVVLSNWGGLETTYVSRQVLRANVPTGVPAGSYDVQVVNPDAATAVLRGALAVVPPAGPTDTPEPSPTPAPTDFIRPLLVVQSYGASAPQITPGQNLDFEMTIVNAGQAAAANVLATFVSGDFVPRATGGVRALGTLAPGQPIRFWQPLFATDELRGKDQAVLKVTTTYTDINGQSYESSFELSFPVVPQAGGGAA
ncbi:MAG: IPT/TIG domain-containing protein, partial [Candidatus Promineofilum sp.]|nr:IPT/TIG domain-containing protein [Promineifilum sp.]